MRFSMMSRFLKDCFSTKYPTVQLFDSVGGWYCFPLKNTHIYDGKFMVKIGDRMYVLAVDLSKMMTYRGKGAPPIQTILYNVKDTKPIDLSDLQTIEDFCKTNGIRKIHEAEALLICAYARYQSAYLAKSDREGVPDVDTLSFEAVIDMLLEVEGHPVNSSERAKRRMEYEDAVKRMGRDNLLQPVQPIASYLGNKLVDDPESITSLIVGASRMDFQWKKISNPAKSPTKWWMLMLGILGVVGIAAVLGYVFLGGDIGTSQEDVFERLKQLQDSGVEAPDDLFADETVQDDGGSLTDRIFAEGGLPFDGVADAAGGVLGSFGVNTNVVPTDGTGLSATENVVDQARESLERIGG